MRVPASLSGQLAGRLPNLAARLPVFDAERFEPLRDAAQRWLAQRSVRERHLLAVLAAVAAAALLWALVWQPLARAHAKAVADIHAYDELIAQLRVAGPDVARVAATRRVSAATVINDSASRAGLTIRRLEPQGARTEVTLEEVPFDKLTGWLAGLEHDAGLTVAAIKIERRPAPGVVTVQLTLKS